MLRTPITLLNQQVALLGVAFSDMRAELVSTAGDPAIMPSASQDISAKVDALIQRVFLIVNERHAADPKPLEDFEDFRERYNQNIKALANYLPLRAFELVRAAEEQRVYEAVYRRSIIARDVNALGGPP